MTKVLTKEIKRIAQESAREALGKELMRMREAGPWNDTVVFNAWRDNAGKGIEASAFAKILRQSLRHKTKSRKAHGSHL